MTKEEKAAKAEEREQADASQKEKETQDQAKPLNPDHKKVEAGKKKFAELEERETKLLQELHGVREEKKKVSKIIVVNTKQASLSDCLAQRKVSQVASPLNYGRPFAPGQHPPVPGALTAEELAAQKK